MMKQINLAEALGKTVKGVIHENWGNRVVISFDDNTFSCLRIDPGYDGDAGQIIDDADFDLLDFNCERLVSVGVCSEAEFLGAEATRELKRRRWTEDRDREEFERLKIKFGKQ